MAFLTRSPRWRLADRWAPSSTPSFTSSGCSKSSPTPTDLALPLVVVAGATILLAGIALIVALIVALLRFLRARALRRERPPPAERAAGAAAPGPKSEAASRSLGAASDLSRSDPDTSAGRIDGTARTAGPTSPAYALLVQSSSGGGDDD